MQNIYSEVGFGIQVDCNYQSNNSSHAVPLELYTMDPKPWPKNKLNDDRKPRLTMDMQHIQLNTHDKSRKASRKWQLARIALNFIDSRGNRHAIEMDNVEDNWSGTYQEDHPSESKGYKLRGDRVGTTSKERFYQFDQTDIEEEWKKKGDDFNAGRVRAPLWLMPTDSSWSSAQSWWDPNTCKFVGMSIMMWPQAHGTGEGAMGSAGKAWHVALFKKLRFVKNWPNNPGHPEYDLINTDKQGTRGYDPTFTREYCNMKI